MYMYLSLSIYIYICMCMCIYIYIYICNKISERSASPACIGLGLLQAFELANTLETRPKHSSPNLEPP